MENKILSLGSAVMYQLFLRPFTPEGTLKSAQAKLAHLAEDGVDIVYLCPVTYSDDDPNPDFWSNRQRVCGLNNPQNPYRVKDYFRIDPEYGADADLASFVAAAHSLNMKVLLDIVYLHCGPSSELVRLHPEFLQHDAEGKVVTNYYRFPVIDFASAGLREYFWSNMVYFVSRFDVDGYRCDCGDLIPLDFWQEGIRRASAVKPELIMLNEGGKLEYCRAENGFATSYRGASRLYEVYEGKISLEEFRRSRAERFAELPDGGRFIDFQENHDFANDAGENRLEKRIGSDAMEASLLVAYTFNGLTFLYTGNEIADCSHHSILGNRTHGPLLRVDWSRAETAEGRRREQFVRQAAALRHSSAAIAQGDLCWLQSSAPDALLAYSRTAGGETLAVLINATQSLLTATVDGDFSDYAEVLSRASAWNRTPDALSLTLAPCGYLVLCRGEDAHGTLLERRVP